MILTDIYGQKHILAADGVRTPTDYVAFASFPGGDGTLLKAQDADGQWYLVDWHGGLLFPEASPYPVSMLIAPDGSAFAVESEDGGGNGLHRDALTRIPARMRGLRSLQSSL